MSRIMSKNMRVEVEIKELRDCQPELNGFLCGGCHVHVFRRPALGARCKECHAKITCITYLG